MDPHILLARLNALLTRAPDVSAIDNAQQENIVWLAQAHALVKRWNEFEASGFKIASDFLMRGMNRNYNITGVIGTLRRAVADLELQVPNTPDQVFEPGAVYDCFKGLGEVVSSADTSLFIVDPYLDDQIFDAYLSRVQAGILIRLMVKNHSASVRAGATAFASQHGVNIEVRKTNALHDRIIFVDGAVCWLVGQSIKDAAITSPTYLAPLSADLVALKLSMYEDTWAKAREV